MLVKYKNYTASIIRLNEEGKEEEEEIAAAAAPKLGIRNHPTGSPNICGMGGMVWLASTAQIHQNTTGYMSYLKINAASKCGGVCSDYGYCIRVGERPSKAVAVPLYLSSA